MKNKQKFNYITDIIRRDFTLIELTVKYINPNAFTPGSSTITYWVRNHDMNEQ